MTIRVRFAPSPTGLLHVGNARTGLFAWFVARQASGVFILRIEDTDRERSERQFEGLIYEDLRWMGLDWDEGPDVGGELGPYRQSERFPIYRDSAARLIEKGRAFWCFCPEQELERQAEQARSEGRPWRYPGTCRNLPDDVFKRRLDDSEPAAVRLRVREGVIRFRDLVHGSMEFSSDVLSDPILLRSDGTPTYNFAVVVDDALMRVSHVIRGDDHLSNTPKQVLIYEALEHAPPRFAHLSTILGPDHTRLSKRHGATAIAQFREAGYLPEALVNYLALLGWSPAAEGSEIVPLEELVQQFSLNRVNKSPAVFDLNKLNFINRHYMRVSSKTRSLAARELERKGWLPKEGQEQWVSMVIDTVLSSVDVISQIPDALEAALSYPAEERSGLRDVLEDPGAIEMLRRFRTELEDCTYVTLEDYKAIVWRLKQVTGRQGRDLFHPLRVGLTGKSSGPELEKLIPLVETAAHLGIDGVRSCKERLDTFLAGYG